MGVSTTLEAAMQRNIAGRIRLKHSRNHPVRAIDTTVFPVAMVVVLTVVLVLLMIMMARPIR
jgi:hypothetical protein